MKASVHCDIRHLQYPYWGESKLPKLDLAEPHRTPTTPNMLPSPVAHQTLFLTRSEQFCNTSVYLILKNADSILKHPTPKIFYKILKNLLSNARLGSLVETD